MTTVSSNTFSPSLMNAINIPSSTASTSTAGSASVASETSAAKMSADFITMLVAQMKNQDPTQPMTSQDMTNSLAQINTVNGINQLNTTMTNLASSLQGSQMSQATSLIGQSVLVPSISNNATLVNGQSQFGAQLAANADNVTVTIKNQSGNVVDVMNLGPQSAGNVPISWNGTDVNGNPVPTGTPYTFSVNASSGGQAIGVTTMQAASVVGVSNSTSGVMLNLNNNTTVSPSSVQTVL